MTFHFIFLVAHWNGLLFFETLIALFSLISPFRRFTVCDSEFSVSVIKIPNGFPLRRVYNIFFAFFFSYLSASLSLVHVRSLFIVLFPQLDKLKYQCFRQGLRISSRKLILFVTLYIMLMLVFNFSVLMVSSYRKWVGYISLEATLCEKVFAFTIYFR